MRGTQPDENRTVIVTGASKGIGRAIAVKLARQGYRLVINYLSDESGARETLRQCAEFHSNAVLCRADVSVKQDVAALMQQTLDAFGSIDVLINNAGINIDRPLHKMEEADWDRVVDVNMKGVFLCSQQASRTMLEQPDGGVILNIGASTGIRARTNGINYCAAKAGVLVMTKCLAMELGPKVRVNCLIPGMTRTQELVERFQLDDPEKLAAVERLIPLQRVCTPEEIADVVSFAISHEARYINGQKIIVDGGQFMY